MKMKQLILKGEVSKSVTSTSTLNNNESFPNRLNK